MEPSTRRERDDHDEEAVALMRHLADHAEYDAALLFTRGQYLLYHRRGREVRVKGVSAQARRAAFVEEPVDSGWLPPGIIRYGQGRAGTFFVRLIPASRHTLLLSTTQADGREPLSVPLPPLLFAGVGTTYYV